NRCFPTKAIRGWLAGSSDDHCALVAEYFRRSGVWDEAHVVRPDLTTAGDPLYGVWARRR
ncbi:MAG: SAM-dependent methyltransferase, partial [Actinobacteria bacterium]|nr:SAM-dependent methyltransferase [Actinomycetota bacterium]